MRRGMASTHTRGIVRQRSFFESGAGEHAHVGLCVIVSHTAFFESGAGERGENLGVTATTAWLKPLPAFLMAGTAAPDSTEAEAPIAPAALKARCE